MVSAVPESSHSSGFAEERFRGTRCRTLRVTGNSRRPLLMDASAGLRSETTKAEVLEEQFHVKKKCSFVLRYRKGHSRSWEQHEGKGRLSCNDDSAVLLGALLCGDSAALTP